jgi:hypothetical protein
MLPTTVMVPAIICMTATGPIPASRITGVKGRGAGTTIAVDNEQTATMTNRKAGRSGCIRLAMRAARYGCQTNSTTTITLAIAGKSPCTRLAMSTIKSAAMGVRARAAAAASWSRCRAAANKIRNTMVSSSTSARRRARSSCLSTTSMNPPTAKATSVMPSGLIPRRRWPRSTARRIAGVAMNNPSAKRTPSASRVMGSFVAPRRAKIALNSATHSSARSVRTGSGRRRHASRASCRGMRSRRCRTSSLSRSPRIAPRTPEAALTIPSSAAVTGRHPIPA